MWKEEYRVGIESIDVQHMELFYMADELLKAIEGESDSDVYRKAVSFLKEYVVVHFRDEEAYQASVQYEGMEEHVRQHQAFIKTLLSYEERLEASGYELKIVKDLAGTLTAWLIYHVADADQKITGKRKRQPMEFPGAYIDCFRDSMLEVLNTMAGLDVSGVQADKTLLSPMAGDVFVKIGMLGDFSGSAVYGFSKELTFRLFEAMTLTAPKELDEMVCSALAEIANITSGNVATALTVKGFSCDIRTPEVSVGEFDIEVDLNGFRIHTDMGELEVAVWGGAE